MIVVFRRRNEINAYYFVSQASLSHIKQSISSVKLGNLVVHRWIKGSFSHLMYTNSLITPQNTVSHPLFNIK